MTGQSAQTKVRDLRIFWKIVVDACCTTDIKNTVRKEVSVWGLDTDNVWRRYVSHSFTASGSAADGELTVEIACPGDEKKKAVLENCLVCLDGCYLVVDDPGLKEQAKVLMRNLGDRLAPTDPVSVLRSFLNRIAQGKDPDNNQFQIQNGAAYYVGRNILLEAEFETDKIGTHPIFYHPKHSVPSNMAGTRPKPGAIYAQEENGHAGERKATWEISPDRFDSDSYHLVGLHTLHVSQDENFIQHNGSSSNSPQQGRYFEFLVDTIPIRKPAIDDSVHLFDTGKTRFYIGFSPDLGQDRILRGCIRRIVFDPNASCLAC